MAVSPSAFGEFVVMLLKMLICCQKLFFVLSLTRWQNKLECLTLNYSFIDILGYVTTFREGRSHSDLEPILGNNFGIK